MTQINLSNDGRTTVVKETETNTISIITTGPQGPEVDDFTFNGDDRVDGSVVYFNATTGRYQADSTQTKLTLVDGGNF